jgi:hypothetical protein
MYEKSHDEYMTAHSTQMYEKSHDEYMTAHSTTQSMYKIGLCTMCCHVLIL